MLRELHIKNFVLIESETISFDAGLNVISGETGAGKSIILQALQLILGARTKSGMLRKGTDAWEIQALFDLSQESQELIDSLPDIAQSEELVLARSMNAQGRGKVYVNGQLASVAVLEDIASKLINICGQGQHVSLLSPQYHVQLLDSFGDYDAVLTAYEDCYKKWSALQKRLRITKQEKEQLALKRAQLSFIVEDLSALNLQENVREELEARIKKLSKAEEVLRESQVFRDILLADGGLFASAAHAEQSLKKLASFDEGFLAVVKNLQDAQELLADAEKEHIKILDSVELNDEELENLRGELSELARLERKYSLDASGLQKLFEESEKELANFMDEDGEERLEAELSQETGRLEELAARLSRERKQTARVLAKKVEAELFELNMKSAVLRVTQESGEYHLHGNESIEFLIASNKGEDAKPLRQVASGGELSRITLVLKKILREKTGVNVLVFDEVDVGISGKVARAVGEKLKSLASNSQVLCITHLAQVASLADAHFLVEKKEGKRTNSHIKRLDGEVQIDEIARMLAGYELTSASRESAKELMGLR